MVDDDIKLDFSDVLFKPQKSALKSRSEVNLMRSFKFLHSRGTWTGVPIISSNMDTTGTFEMGAALAKHKCITTIHKYYSLDDWRHFGSKRPEALSYVAVSAGVSQRDYSLVQSIADSLP